MKMLKLYIVYLMLLSGLYACKGNNKLVPDTPKDSTDKTKGVEQKVQPQMSIAEMIQRKWRPIQVDPPGDTSRENEMKSTTIEFRKDGKVIVLSAGREPDENNYILSVDGKQFLVEEHDKYESNAINELTKDKLVFTTKNNQRITAIPVR